MTGLQRSCLAVMLMVVAGCAGCGFSGQKNVVVFAAASTTDAIGDIKRQLDETGGPTLTTSFDSSARLATQIEAGAAADVFLSANVQWADYLEEKGFVTSRKGEPTGARGGRARRHFRLEKAGLEALQRSRAELEAMWDGFEAGEKISS